MTTDIEPAIVASVLSADQGRLADVCRALEQAGIDGIQWDVMDGHFVPNLTVGPGVVEACRAATELPFEAHLMIEEPERSMERYIAAGCDCVIVHAEACRHLHRTLESIRASGARAGVALNPSTPLDAVRHVVDLVDLLLVMTVNPGFGGQSYIATMEPEIREARTMVDSEGRDVPVEVDGGIAQNTIAAAAGAGADRFVVGSALFAPEGFDAILTDLRGALGTGPRVGVS
ncbi:MAG: ribulose-phosphate 3-epimerase [Actinomycetota bacterium]